MAEQDRDLPAAHFCMGILIFNWFKKVLNMPSGHIQKACFTNVFYYFLQNYVPSWGQIGKASETRLIYL